MQLLGKNYFENEQNPKLLAEGSAASSKNTGDENAALDSASEEGLEALCEAVTRKGHQIPAWMTAAGNVIRENGRHLVVAASVLVIGFAVYLNWAMYSGDNGPNDNLIDASDGALTGVGTYLEDDGGIGQSGGVQGTAVSDDNYFAVSQINRQRARDEALAVLQDVVDGAENLSDVQNEALAEIAQIAEDIEHEATIESLIKGKGFAECVAVISGESANVIVKSSELLPNEVAQIQEIVYETSGIVPTNVKIIGK